MSHTDTLAASHCATQPRRLPGLFSLLSLWRSRSQLAQLDENQLADVGLSRRDATREAARAPWDVPAHWRD